MGRVFPEAQRGTNQMERNVCVSFQMQHAWQAHPLSGTRAYVSSPAPQRQNFCTALHFFGFLLLQPTKSSDTSATSLILERTRHLVCSTRLIMPFRRPLILNPPPQSRQWIQGCRRCTYEAMKRRWGKNGWSGTHPVGASHHLMR